MLEFLERVQGTWLSRAISESVWGYPIVGAVHVLAIALFGGAVLISDLSTLRLAFRNSSEITGDLRMLRSVGLVIVLTTGVLLFASGAVGYYDRFFFRIKIVLLVLIFLNALQTRFVRLRAWLSLALWAAVIFAARGTAYL